MIRERRLNTIAYNSGGVSTVELPKDAVYHQIQMILTGQVSSVNGAGSTANKFAQGFPFNIINRIRLVRNGSDVVYQGSGKQLAKEGLYLNQRFPQARLWTATNALLTASVNGVTIPSNSEGIGCNAAVFLDAGTVSSTVVTNFRASLEMWLQLGVSDSYFATLVDARPLASFVLEITWDSITNFIVAGTSATLSLVGAQAVVMSYDQDNVDMGVSFGTFKRASLSSTQFSLNSSQNQQLLPRGNYYFGIIFETLVFRSGGLITIPEPGEDIVTEIQNRINSNYSLRDVFFQDLQAKNRNNGRVPSSPYDPWSGSPNGWAFLDYACTGDSIKELIPTFTMDQFDLLINLGAGTEAGAITGNPVINIMTQEVIPGRSIAPNQPRGSFAGSMSSTSAKPGA